MRSVWCGSKASATIYMTRIYNLYAPAYALAYMPSVQYNIYTIGYN